MVGHKLSCHLQENVSFAELVGRDNLEFIGDTYFGSRQVPPFMFKFPFPVSRAYFETQVSVAKPFVWSGVDLMLNGSLGSRKLLVWGVQGARLQMVGFLLVVPLFRPHQAVPTLPKGSGLGFAGNQKAECRSSSQLASQSASQSASQTAKMV